MRKLFDQAGWWNTGPLYDAIDVAEIVAHFDLVLAGRYDLGRAPRGINRFGDQMVKIADAWWSDSVIRRVVLSRPIAMLAAELLGVDELYLWADSLYWKAPGAAGQQAQIGWHQDKQYWQTSSTDKMITACVALYPTGPTQGGLRFADGSHRWGLIGGSEALSGSDNAEVHETPLPPPGREWREVCPVLAPGSVTFHHCLTFHGSGPNLMRMPRRSITIHMIAGDGRLVNWQPVADGHLETVGLGNLFRGALFPRLWP